MVSFPVSIYYFNQFSLLSWLANAILVPVISMIVFPAGLLALALGLLYIPAWEKHRLAYFLVKRSDILDDRQASADSAVLR